MKIVHFCAGLRVGNGMANTARQFVAEEIAAGHDSRLTNDLSELASGIDRVHIHGAWLPAVHRAARRAKTIGAELVVRPAGSYDPVRRRYHGWKKRMMAPWEHAMLDRADVVQATCRQEADWIRAYHPSARIRLTDLKRFFKFDLVGCAAKLSEIALRSRDIPLKVLYLGRQHPLKGVDFLRRAVSELNDPCGAGTPDCRKGCVALREVSDADGEELERIWDWCDVLCLPTLSENFGRVVAEALEHGRPVITTDGAPAWEPREARAKAWDAGEARAKIEAGKVSLPPTPITSDDNSSLLYLRGYRDGTDARRVEMLKDALMRLIG